jgi:hypothetical protein
MKRSVWMSVLVAASLMFVGGAAVAQDKKGKTSLETSTSRAKENKVVPKKSSQNGTSATQKRATDKAAKSLDRNSVAQQQQTTKAAVNKTVPKKK